MALGFITLPAAWAAGSGCRPGRQGELPADPLLAPVPGAPLQGHLLDPAEPFFDLLADALADRVARMACRPAVDRRAAVNNCDVRRRVELAGRLS